MFSIAIAEGGTEECEERFYKEAPSKWDDYLRQLQCIEGSMEMTIRRDSVYATSTSSKIMDTYSAKFLWQYPSGLFEWYSDGTMDVMTVGNETYGFRLEPGGEGEWTLKSLDKVGQFPKVFSRKVFLSEMTKKQPLPESIDLIGRYVFPCLQLNKKLLPDLLEQKEFVVTDAEQMVDDDTQLIRIRFVYNPPRNSPLSRRLNIRSGEIYLMPDHFWLIKKSEVVCEFDETWTSVTENQYELKGDIPLLSRSTTVNYLYGPERKFRTSREENYYYVVHDSVDKAKFFLSHYGIPEPDFGEHHTGWVRYSLMIVGLLMVGFALWRIYSNRGKNKT